MLNKKIKTYVDLDGTICGETKWTSLWYNTRRLFTTGLLMELPKTNWNILTGRPKLDRMFIKWACSKYGLYPDDIITSPNWFYEFKNDLEVASWKSSVLSRVLCNESLFVAKVIYCDESSEILSNMTPHPDLVLCRPSTLIKTIRELEEEYGPVNG